QPGLLRHSSHEPRLFDAVRHRLLHIDVLARPQRRQRDGRVHVVRSADDHRVATLELLQHHPVIAELLRVWKSLGRAGREFPIHIAQSDDVLAGDGRVAQNAAALPSDANAGDVQLLARRSLPLTQDMAWNDQETQPRRSRVPQEAPTRNGSVSLFALVAVNFHEFNFVRNIIRSPPSRQARRKWGGGAYPTESFVAN